MCKPACSTTVHTITDGFASVIIITHAFFIHPSTPSAYHSTAASNSNDTLDSIPARGVFNGATSAASWIKIHSRSTGPTEIY